MLSSQISAIDRLSYRQIRSELKKRQLDSTGRKTELVKRFKSAYTEECQSMLIDIDGETCAGLFTERLDSLTAQTRFHDLPNEIYREIFDYLCPLDIVHSFSTLNDRFDRVIEDIPMKLRLGSFSKSKYVRTLKRIVPKLIPQTVALDLGSTSTTNDGTSTYCSSETVIDLFTQLYSFTQFSSLRFLSLASPTVEQLQSLLVILPSLSSLRLLRVLENDYRHSQHPIVFKLTLGNDRNHTTNRDSTHLQRLVIDTSPPFNTLTLLQKHLTNKVTLNRIQLNIRCNLFFYPHALTLIDYDGLSRLLTSVKYIKMNVLVSPCTPAFDIMRRFPQVQHLSVRSIAKASPNGHQWAELLAQMPNLSTLDLNLALDSEDSNQELQTFQTKFWLDRQWFVQCIRSSTNSSAYRIRHPQAQVRY